MITGESILSGAPKTCQSCGKTPEFQVLSSGAGYYIGTECDCGPYTRESIYFPDREGAKHCLKVVPDSFWRR